MYEIIIIGSGFSGSTIARLLAEKGKKVLIIEKRDHFGGNSYDYKENDITIHKYGPHIFHTKYDEVIKFITKFSDFIDYTHKVNAYIDGKFVSLPFNLYSLYQVFDEKKAKEYEKILLDNFRKGERINILDLKKLNIKSLKPLVNFIYKKIFYNYTKKQWGKTPEEIDPKIFNRVPVVIDYDDRYFTDKFQKMPKFGFNYLFRNILDHKNIDIIFNTDFKEIIKFDSKYNIYLNGKKIDAIFIYTGEIDYFFDYKLGKLRYRSLKFNFKTIEEKFFQDVSVVNYPNDFSFTRITEYKHFLKEKSTHTIISEEYPGDYNKNSKDFNIPYYPFFDEVNSNKYENYKKLTESLPKNFFFLGRLAKYKYINMDMAIKEAIDLYKTNLNNLL